MHSTLIYLYIFKAIYFVIASFSLLISLEQTTPSNSHSILASEHALNKCVSNFSFNTKIPVLIKHMQPILYALQQEMQKQNKIFIELLEGSTLSQQGFN